MNLPALVRNLSEAAGIPAELVPSVVHRAEMAKLAVESMREWRRGRNRRGPPIRVLASRVVTMAAEDFRRGMLERRVE